MRAAFTLVLLLLAVFYTYQAFGDLTFLSSIGRIGPGFFPRIIGVLLVAFCLYSLYLDLKRARGVEDEIAPDFPTVLLVAALSGLFVVAAYVLGALPGMILFLAVTLSLLNRGRHVTNALVAILFPALIFVGFRYWLNATMPPGLLGLSI